MALLIPRSPRRRLSNFPTPELTETDIFQPLKIDHEPIGGDGLGIIGAPPGGGSDEEASPP